MSAAEKLMTPGSHGDVATWTGAHTKARQIKVLAKNGIRHIINAAGWPVVAWSAIEQPAAKTEAPRTTWRSNKAA